MEDDQARLPGVYALLVTLSQETRVTVGRLGACRFPAGGYAYVGSARGGLGRRIGRYFRPSPRLHWHIDYLLPHGALAGAIIAPTSRPLECPLARALGETSTVIPRFGSSDCRCPGHLFHHDDPALITSAALESFRGLGCIPTVIPALTEGGNR